MTLRLRVGVSGCTAAELVNDIDTVYVKWVLVANGCKRKSNRIR